MSWRPLLDGALKDRARECVDAIGHDPAFLESIAVGDPSLAGGMAGTAILYGYMWQVDAKTGVGSNFSGLTPRIPAVPPDNGSVPTTAVQEYAERARCGLNAAIAALEAHATEASLYSGLTGVGWAMAHLQDRVPGIGGEQTLAEIDEVLLQHLEQSPWTDDYDLVSGLVGFGVYALQRLPRPAASACLTCVIEYLVETAEHRQDGTTWWTDPRWLLAQTRENCPDGYYNLGLAHGVPGVIALLGRACAKGIAVDRARPLLDGAVRWLLANQDQNGFAHWVEADKVDKPARLAWCYGDPGIAVALLGAARSVGEPAWEREALAIARRATERPADLSGVKDAGLCHGAAGLGHLFNRMHQATGETWLAEAARLWFERAMEMRRPGQGIGGFESWMPRDDGTQAWVNDPALLTGSAGVALALLAATSSIEPAWDQMLLVDIPPDPARLSVEAD